MTKPTCATCKFVDENSRCRRLPPQQLVNHQRDSYGSDYFDHYAGWAYVDANDWCGEWSQIEEQKLNEPTLRPLTDDHRRILSFVKEFIETNGAAPTESEIMDGLGYERWAELRVKLINLRRHCLIGSLPRDQSTGGIQLIDATDDVASDTKEGSKK